jgi:hypothetical protein
MSRKRIVYTYTDRLDRKLKSPESLFPIKVNGDTSSDSYESDSSINIRNEFPQKILDQNLNKNVISDLGNDFIINDIKSVKDDEHHFYGAKKFIDLKYSFFSGATANLSGTFSNFDRVREIWPTQTNVFGLTISPIDGAVYYCGAMGTATALSSTWVVLKYQETLEGPKRIIVDTPAGPGLHIFDSPTSVAVSPIDGAVYVCGNIYSGNELYWVVRRSPTGNSGTFETVDYTKIVSQFSAACTPYDIAVSPIDGAVYVCGKASASFAIRRSPSGLSGTFSTVEISGGGATGTSIAYSIAVSPIDGKVFVGGIHSSSWVIKSSANGLSRNIRKC